MNYCLLCGRECTGEVSNDDGFTETIFGNVSDNPTCLTCEPPKRGVIFDGKAVAGGTFQRTDC